MLRPITQAVLFLNVKLIEFSIDMIPSGVQGICCGIPSDNNPWFFEVRPSTSLVGRICSIIFSVLNFGGNGSCSRIPSTFLSRLKAYLTLEL